MEPKSLKKVAVGCGNGGNGGIILYDGGLKHEMFCCAAHLLDDDSPPAPSHVRVYRTAANECSGWRNHYFWAADADFIRTRLESEKRPNAMAVLSANSNHPHAIGRSDTAILYIFLLRRLLPGEEIVLPDRYEVFFMRGDPPQNLILAPFPLVEIMSRHTLYEGLDDLTCELMRFDLQISFASQMPNDVSIGLVQFT